MSNWTDAEKVTVAILKLLGTAALFLNRKKETNQDDITLSNLHEIFVELFRVKHLDQFHYSDLRNAIQHSNETPEEFADRCSVTVLKLPAKLLILCCRR